MIVLFPAMKKWNLLLMKPPPAKDKRGSLTGPILSALATAGKYAIQPGDTIYMVRARDTLKSIAKRFHISAIALRTANHLDNKRLKPGKQIVIPTHAATATAAAQAPSDGVMPGDTIYMVRRGDTVEKIARRFRTTASAIRITNLIDNDSLAEGEKLVIPTRVRG